MLVPLLRLACELLASTVAPDRCASCDEPVPMRTAFCPSCAASLVPAVDCEPGVFAAYIYGGALARAITHMKYESRPELARPLSAMAVRAAARMGRSPDLVVPVPLHPSRLALRGFNQAALLARPVARFLSAPLSVLALRRTRATAQQAGQGRIERAHNLKGAFAVPRSHRVKGKRVLLVDDVYTTGATIEACRTALSDAGAVDVSVVVVARAQAGALP